MEVKRLPPCPDYDIRGTEHWLEEMAAKGFRLCRGHAFQYGFAYFVTEEPSQTRYRLVPAEKIPQRIATPNAYPEEPDQETIRFHADFGWDYVTYRGQFWIFACTDPQAPELNTDPRVQAIALETVEKRLKVHLFWILLYGLIMNSGHQLPFFETLLWAGWYSHVPKLLFLLCALLAWLPGLVHIIRFRKKLKQGIFPDEHTAHSPAKTYALQLLRTGVFVIWIGAIILLMPDYTKYGDELTAAQAAELDYITAADLFPEAEIVHISSSNYIYEWDTDAAPACLDLGEHFRLTFPDGTTVNGYWNLNRFETDFDWIAAGYCREARFFERLRGFFQGSFDPIPMNVEGADWVGAYHIDSDYYKDPLDVILIRKGNVALEASLHLFSEHPDAPSLEEIAAMLIANEETGGTKQ